MFDLLIRRNDGLSIGIEDEFITALGDELSGARKEIDARGLSVLPGMIDAHVHFNEPGRTDWEGGATGSRALAAGGGVLFVDMPLNSSPCTLDAKSFDLKRAALERESIADFALWGGIVPGNRAEMAELAARGVIGFKAFMCNSGLPEFPHVDAQALFDGMAEAARLNLPVAVHAEDETMTSHATGVDIAAFLRSRPVAAETAAIRQAGQIARETGCRLHIVHISSGAGVAAALEARSLGADISIETCPHYLFFDEEDLHRIGAFAKCAPPLRTKEERQRLREAAFNGIIDIIGSDHSPCPPEMKNSGNFLQIWGGIAGVQVTIPTLLEIGLSLERIAATTAANPALRFGLALRGAIAIGNYADLIFIDTSASTSVSQQTLLHRHRVNPYIGHTLKGAIRRTIRRGETVYSDGVITAQTQGRFVHA